MWSHDGFCRAQGLNALNGKARGSESEDFRSYMQNQHGCTDVLPQSKTVRHLSLNTWALWCVIGTGQHSQYSSSSPGYQHPSSAPGYQHLGTSTCFLNIS